MIEAILPAGVASAVESGGGPAATLYPEEAEAVGRAVATRRSEFAAGRACARAALAKLGIPPGPIPVGPRGAPRWPPSVTGTITHCRSYAACAVARTSDVAMLGIDAEPNEPLPHGLLADIARPAELAAIRELSAAEPRVCWDRLVFSAKESVYKAWFPIAERWLGFDDVELRIDRSLGALEARFLLPPPGSSKIPPRLAGRWLAREDLIVTAFVQRSRDARGDGGDSQRSG